MNWIELPKQFPEENETVMLKIHITSAIGNYIDKEDTVLATYKNKKWIIDGKELIENDYPIMRKPIAWNKD